MRTLINVIAVFGLIMTYCTMAAGTTPENPDNRVSRILERARPGLVHLKVVSSKSDVEAWTGSGFAIDEHGWMATNYHVVSEVVLKPEIYQLRFITPDGQKGNAQVIAIDVANDLAIIQTSLRPRTHFSLAPGTPVRGEEVFALGFPNRQPVTITQGLYNGQVEGRYVARYHYTGPVNGGMSGGPSLNRNGEVLGINVESRRDSQLVSYLVPAAALSDLIDRTRRQSIVIPDAKVIETQVSRYAEALIEKLRTQLGTRTHLGNYLVPDGNELMKCSGGTKLDEGGEYETTSHFCSPRSDIFLSDDTPDGAYVSIFAMMWRNIKMDPYRFAQTALPSITSKPDTPRVDTGPFACRYQTLGLKGMRVRAEICVQKFRQFALSDYVLKLSTIDRSDHRLSVNVRLNSMPEAVARSFIKSVLESISWQTDTSSKS